MSRMELFFDDAAMPRYWGAGPASTSSNIVCSHSWPPVIAIAGYAPCLRAWEPTKRGRRLKPSKTSQVEEVQFTPVDGFREMDGHCFVACAIEEDLLAAVTAGNESKVVVWSTADWRRLAVLQPGCGVACLALSGAHLAAGTVKGTVHVWRRMDDNDWQPLFQVPLQLDSLPVHNVALSSAPDGQALVVVHSRGKNAVGVWRLTDGRLVHKLEMRTTGEDGVAVTAANMSFMHCQGPILAGVSHVQGEDPVVQLMDVLTREGEVVEAPDRLQGRGRPLCADFDGALLAVGCEDGALVTFGYRGWIRWHTGAVGAVHVMRGRMQVLSACASGDLCLWDAEGGLLVSVNVGFQVAGLAGGDLFAVVGGHRGELQVAVLPYVKEAVGASDPTREVRPATACTKYEHWYDLRPAQPVPFPVHSPLVGCLGAGHDDVLRCFAVPRAPVTSSHFQELLRIVMEKQQEEKAKGGAGGEEEEAGGGGDKAGSGFDMKSALKGAKSTQKDEAAAQEAVKKQQLQQMGEGAGVARSGAKVVLPSSVELLGRKCDSVTCMARSGATAGQAGFSRCGGCKKVYYCSAHCQRTHWRDGHSKQCKEWQKEQQAAAPAAGPAIGPLPQGPPPAPTQQGPTPLQAGSEPQVAQPQSAEAAGPGSAVAPAGAGALASKALQEMHIRDGVVGDYQVKTAVDKAAVTAGADDDLDELD